MDIASFVSLISNVTFVVFAGILVAAVGLFFFDRPAHRESAQSIIERHEHEGERHAA